MPKKTSTSNPDKPLKTPRPKPETQADGRKKAAYTIPPKTDRASLRAAKKILDQIELAERPRGWAGHKAEGEPFKLISTKLPSDIVEALYELPGAHAWHIEKALRFYMMVMRASK